MQTQPVHKFSEQHCYKSAAGFNFFTNCALLPVYVCLYNIKLCGHELSISIHELASKSTVHGIFQHILISVCSCSTKLRYVENWNNCTLGQRAVSIFNACYTRYCQLDWFTSDFSFLRAKSKCTSIERESIHLQSLSIILYLIF